MFIITQFIIIERYSTDDVHRTNNVDDNRAESLLVELKYIEYLHSERYKSIMRGKSTVPD